MSKSKEQLAYDAVMAIRGSSISASKRRHIEEAMDQYAKQQIISYEIWLEAELNNDGSFNYEKTPEQLYDLFIENQNKQS